jgi:hypothetical protein
MNGASVFILRTNRARHRAISASFAQIMRPSSAMVIELLGSINGRMEDLE